MIDLLKAADAARLPVGGKAGGAAGGTTEGKAEGTETTGGVSHYEGKEAASTRRHPPHGPSYRTGMVGEATIHIMEAEAMWRVALEALEVDPLCLVDKIEPGSESHFLCKSASGGSDGDGKGVYRYEVRPA